MPVAKITGQGLFAIACSVALLWGCLIGEQAMLHHAASERVKAFREMERLQRKLRPAPANSPLPLTVRRPTVAAA